MLTVTFCRFPFYGVQFHPEKNPYEWVPNKNITHTPNAILTSQYYAQFFVNECRKSPNRFYSVDEINNHVIYNFQPTFTGVKGSAFNQCYLFEKNAAYPNHQVSWRESFFTDDSDI
jgi:gamma-glutamyl hydrolase